MADLNLQITLSEPRESYEPGSNIRGQVVITSAEGQWEADAIELLLFWRTSGIGTRDEGVVETLQLCEKDAKIPSHFTRDFDITLPLQPYTYQGKLIKINWHLGLFVKKSWINNPETEIEIIIKPGGMPVNSGASPTADSQPIFYDDSGNPLAGPPIMS